MPEESTTLEAKADLPLKGTLRLMTLNAVEPAKSCMEWHYLAGHVDNAVSLSSMTGLDTTHLLPTDFHYIYGRN